MEVRLNKLISDSGLCSRREADKFIEMGRVTVNGKAPVIGKKVTEKDVVLVDGHRVSIGKQSSERGFQRAAPGKANNLIFGKTPKPTEEFILEENTSPATPSYRKNMPLPKVAKKSKPAKAKGDDSLTLFATPKPTKSKTTFRENIETDSTNGEVQPREKFGKYNKYAAARKAGKGLSADENKTAIQKAKDSFNETQLIKDAKKPQFGKSLSKGAVAQRLAAAPKSAALRKSSKNNPVNRAKFIASRNKSNEFDE
jgi:ribosomal 50S subunit-recycling heat shock protein